MTYLDMDGVLADLVGAVIRHTGLPMPTYYGEWAKYDFDWVIPDEIILNMEVGVGARELIAQYPDACILTAAPLSSARLRWLSDNGIHLGILSVVDKYVMCTPGDLLIDDCPENCRLWESRGGWAILWDQPWNRSVK